MTITGRDSRAKALGAYYTDEAVAAFLVRWAVRAGSDTVLDPSFGGGVFLRAACARAESLGGASASTVSGVELDPKTFAETLASLDSDFSTDRKLFACCDFFELPPGARQADAVVGNPPFIRYQRFTGGMRSRALERAAAQGVRLSELSSSWAPFLVHAASMLKAGGRLAMVLPYELTYAVYARPVLAYLATAFERVTLLTFQNKLFGTLSEDTLLLLADGKGRQASQFAWRHVHDMEDLDGILDERDLTRVRGARAIEHAALCAGDEKLLEYLLSPAVRRLYRDLKSRPEIATLGSLAQVGIGYVTGDNSFFHLDKATVGRWDIPPDFLRPAVWRGKAFAGLHFTWEDWEHASSAADAGHLLTVAGDSHLPPSLRAYIADGERRGVPARYKCRVRSPWYVVPGVARPDAFLTYMNGTTPRLVANLSDAVAPNTLHVVHLRGTCPLAPCQLALLWHNSLTRLSAEIEGHALGGGMLKLEPTEARSVLVPVLRGLSTRILAKDVDEICRKEGVDKAIQHCDQAVLQRGLGLTKAECRLLRSGADLLLGRRYSRNGA